MGLLTKPLFLARIVVCIFCLTDGICRLTPQWSEPLYEMQDIAFRQVVAPVWQKDFFDPMGVPNVDMDILKTTLGWVEVLAAVLLLTPMKRYAGAALAVVLGALAYAEVKGDRPQYMQQCGLAGASAMLCIAAPPKHKRRRLPPSPANHDD